MRCLDCIGIRDIYTDARLGQERPTARIEIAEAR